MVAFAGIAPGLAREVKPAGKFVDEVISNCKKSLARLKARL